MNDQYRGGLVYIKGRHQHETNFVFYRDDFISVESFGYGMGTKLMLEGQPPIILQADMNAFLECLTGVVNDAPET